MKRRVLFLVNPISGTGKQQRILNRLERYINTQRIEFDLAIGEHPGELHYRAREAARNELDAVVVIGGDGTINEVGSALLHSNTALGIIPAGSGNGIARSLRIPLRIEKAIKLINRFPEKVIDTGQVRQGRPFIGIAGMGFDAHVGHVFLHLENRGLKAYVKTVIEEYGSYPGAEVTYQIDNNPKVETNAFVICAANTSQYGNNAHIAPHAEADDGTLDFVVIKDFPKIFAPLLLTRLFNRSLLRSRFVDHIRGKSLRIRSEQPLLHLDGEPWVGETDVELSVNPRSLKVIAPL